MGKIIWLTPSFIKLEKHQLPSGWITERIDSICNLYQGGKLKLTKESDYLSFGFPAFSAAGQDGHVAQAEFQDIEAVILSAIGANCGRCFFASGNWTTLANVQAIIPNEKKIHAKYLFYRVNRDDYWVRSGSAQPFIKPQSIKNAWVSFPKNIKVQQKIAAILTTVDTAIEKTESLIEKYRKIKTGLMNDLFTRGIGPDGKLRPPRSQAPELYKKTELGWIPKEWAVKPLTYLMESLIDGPFGSNLKTEHYVISPGTRVIRLQNIKEYSYDDSDKAFVSNEHALFLCRNKVRENDVLIAGLGDNTFPVGRACVYPPNIDEAINKADCFRGRCHEELMRNKFLMLFLNSQMAKSQIRHYIQGVTRQRINTGNIKKLNAIKASPKEQDQIISKYEAISKIIDNFELESIKLQKQKSGLMQDLLTGKVEVTVPDNEVVHG